MEVAEGSVAAETIVVELVDTAEAATTVAAASTSRAAARAIGVKAEEAMHRTRAAMRVEEVSSCAGGNTML